MSNRASQQAVIVLQRAYDPATDEASFRILVDRYWPRGCKRESLRLDGWARELAPSPALIQWFGHRPDRWPEFRQRYLRELDGAEQRKHLADLLDQASGRPITLIYGARDRAHNQAVVLRERLAMAMARPADSHP